nr:hypothetical protein BaRGS_019653 [Batillaria attramentaria]
MSNLCSVLETLYKNLDSESEDSDNDNDIDDDALNGSSNSRLSCSNSWKGPGNYGTCGANRVIIHTMRRVVPREAPPKSHPSRLCGNSLPIGPIAHPPWVGADLAAN